MIISTEKPFEIKADNNKYYQALLDYCQTANFKYETAKDHLSKLAGKGQEESLHKLLKSVADNLNSTVTEFKKELDLNKKESLTTAITDLDPDVRQKLIEELLSSGQISLPKTANTTAVEKPPREVKTITLTIGGNDYQFISNGALLNKSNFC